MADKPPRRSLFGFLRREPELVVVPDAPVEEALISPSSYETARKFYLQQLLRTAPQEQYDEVYAMSMGETRIHQAIMPPETYVIRYYLPTEGMEVPPELTAMMHGQWHKSPPPPGNQVSPVGPNQEASILAAFQTIETQTRGRFRFEPVSDPDEADIRFGVTELEDMDAVQFEPHRGILFVPRLENLAHAALRDSTALHEVLHALGLEHPQFEPYKVPGAPINNRATFYETVMTYPQINAEGGGPGTLPVSLMPADLAVLRELYPIGADAEIVNQFPDFAPNLNGGPVRITRPDAAAEEVRFPMRGMALQPSFDTPQDVMSFDLTGGFNGTPDWRLEQRDGGIGVLTRSDRGAAYMPLHVERFELSVEVESLRLNGNSEVITQRSHRGVGQKVLAYGTGNRVTMQPGYATVFAFGGSETDIVLDGALERSALPLLTFSWETVPGHTPRPVIRFETQGDGSYRLRLEDKGRFYPPTEVTLRLAQDTPENRAWLRAAVREKHGVERLGAGFEYAVTNVTPSEGVLPIRMATGAIAGDRMPTHGLPEGLQTVQGVRIPNR